MQITLENLRKLVKEALKENYYGSSMQGGLASTAFNAVGPNIAIKDPTHIPVDPVALAEKIRSLIGGDAGFPLGEWGDESLNAAAEAAADALINTEQRDKMSRSIHLYEQRELIREGRKLLEDIEMGNLSTAKVTDAFNRVIDILDSIDMSLDLIYGAVSGHEGPISAIRGMQKSYGRSMGVSQRPQGNSGE